MNQLLLLSGNPKRRKKGKRSAAQRRATRKMLAANRGNPTKRRRRRRKAKSAVSASPRRRRHVSRRRGGRRGGMLSRLLRGGSSHSAMGMVKNGAIGGAGAVGVDVLMGYASNVLPANLVSRVNPDGSMNYLYYATKGALAVGIGLYGGKVLPAGVAPKIAEGALTVMSYEILRGFVPTGIRLGFFNPAPAMGNAGNMGKILNVGGTGKILDINARSGAGAAVARRLNAMNRGR